MFSLAGVFSAVSEDIRASSALNFKVHFIPHFCRINMDNNFVLLHNIFLLFLIL